MECAFADKIWEAYPIKSAFETGNDRGLNVTDQTTKHIPLESGPKIHHRSGEQKNSAPECEKTSCSLDRRMRFRSFKPIHQMII
jgi:hypothetical protein